MQIWNGCNVLNIAGNPMKDINAKLSFLSSGPKVVEWTTPGLQKFSESRIKSCGIDPPRIGKNFKFISEFRIKSCGMDTLMIWHLVDIFEILLLHVLSNDACKFAINLFPISWGPFENINLLYFLFWKCRFEMAVMCLILQETPWKISMQNFHFWVQDQKLWNGPPQDCKNFLSPGSKVVELTPPPGLEKFLNSFLSSGSKVVEWTPSWSDIWWTFLKFYFCMYCPMMHANLQ